MRSVSVRSFLRELKLLLRIEIFLIEIFYLIFYKVWLDIKKFMDAKPIFVSIHIVRRESKIKVNKTNKKNENQILTSLIIFWKSCSYWIKSCWHCSSDSSIWLSTRVKISQLIGNIKGYLIANVSSSLISKSQLK